MKFEKKVVSKQSSDGSTTTTSSLSTNISSNSTNITTNSSSSSSNNDNNNNNTNCKRLNRLFSDFEEKLNDVMEDILKESINGIKVNKTRKYHTVKCRKTPKERPKSNYFEESDHVSFFNDLNDTKDVPKKQITVEKKFKIKKKYTVKKSYEIQELF
jgi:hypothetical protein